MRSVGFILPNNKNVVRKIVTISTFFLITACSPLSNRLINPASNSEIYPLSDRIVTGSISPSRRADYAPSRRVTSRALAPIEDSYDVEPVETPYRKPSAGVVTVRSGDTLLSVAREQGVDAVELAEINALEAPYSLQVGDELNLPEASTARKVASRREVTKRLNTPVKVKKIRTVVVPAVKPKRVRTTKVTTPHKKIAAKRHIRIPKKKPVKIASIQRPLVKKKPEVKRAPVKKLSTNNQSGSGNKFRWPVKGRVISEFGKKPSGAKNDGINLSVPKGAAIVAAETGLVVYSGNELKGFGNLVLIRHKNGWSTAYAHVSEMLVKKGQRVRRGQVIAKAGQTGSVSRPQLHFEIRRGTTPMNPRKILSGSKVALR